MGDEEREAVARAFDTGYVAPCGPQVEAFERKLARLSGRREAVAVASGTAALDLLMDGLSVGPETVVIAPSLTFIATVGPAWHRGARLFFVDSLADGNLDCARLEEALAAAAGASRRVVIGVDLYGRCCAADRAAGLCRRYGATFLCDCAESVGASRAGRPSGAAGLAAVYSFNGNKIVTTSGGGAIVTDSVALAARARKRSQQAREGVSWFEHRAVGYNYRLSNLLAAVGLAQLEKLPTILARRRAIRALYVRALPGLGFLPPVEGENHWLTVALSRNRRERQRLLAALAADGIEARPVWKPLHLQPVFRGCRVFGGSVAEDLFNRGLCLPSGTGLVEADVRRIAGVLLRAEPRLGTRGE